MEIKVIIELSKESINVLQSLANAISNNTPVVLETKKAPAEKPIVEKEPEVPKETKELFDPFAAIAQSLNVTEAELSKVETPILKPKDEKVVMSDLVPTIALVRETLTAKKRAGFNDQIKKILVDDFKVTMVSQLKVGDYAAVIKAVNELK